VTYLLDVNVLIALIDPAHVGHDIAHTWFAQKGAKSWATCPITENGVLRIAGHPKYPNSPGSPALVAPIIRQLCSLSGHVFWHDSMSLLASDLANIDQVRTPGQLTDTYLLALAAANEGQLATLDRRLSPKAVRHGRAALHVIG
jgi:toxin-antitoxin system PIN domain toxin